MNRIAKITLWSLALTASLIVVPMVWNGDVVAEETSPGQTVFMAQKCNMCHAVSTVGIEAKMKSPKMMGPDLVGVGQRVDAETMGKYLRKEAQLEGKDHKKEWKGTPEELETLIAWINAQKAE